MTSKHFPAKFGKYILLDRLNAGGMAEVFVAKAYGVEGFERLVAIKCMLPALLSDSQFTAMFVDEARLAAQVAHANVVQIYELGRQAERLYIAMELVHGRDLRHIVRTAQLQNQPLPAAFCAYVISKAAEGLDYAHRRLAPDGTPLGLVHRDVSPQNILVSYDGEVKVVDFGIAKAAAEVRATETQVGVLKGKFAYMAPEQVLGEAIDHRADIFALGSVLFEALSGQRLFNGENDLVVLERVRDAVLPNLRAMLSPEAERCLPVLTRALSLQAMDRFGWASEMAEALEPMLIEDQSIFGAKRAASVMQNLYRADIEQNTALLRSYAEIGADNCVSEIESDAGAKATPAVVYESTFFGATPQSHVPSKPSVTTGSSDTGPMHAQQLATQIGVSTTSSGTRRPVTLSRRSTGPAKPQARTQVAQLDALAAPASPFAPLDVASGEGARVPNGQAGQTSQTYVIPPTSGPRGVRRVLRQLKVFALLSLVAVGGAVWRINLALDEPITWEQVVQVGGQAKRILHPRKLATDIAHSKMFESWLFSSPAESAQPTALARHLAQQEARAQAAGTATKPGHTEASEGLRPDKGSAAANSDSAADALADDEGAQGFLTVRVSKNVQARLTIDDGVPVWAPLVARPVALGHHVVVASRHRADGHIEERRLEVDVGPGHSKSEPLTVTLTF